MPAELQIVQGQLREIISKSYRLSVESLSCRVPTVFTTTSADPDSTRCGAIAIILTFVYFDG